MVLFGKDWQVSQINDSLFEITNNKTRAQIVPSPTPDVWMATTKFLAVSFVVENGTLKVKK